MSDWEVAWERDKSEVGRAMHEGWKRQQIANGVADHPFSSPGPSDARHEAFCALVRCGRYRGVHHDDMIPWEDLPPDQQAFNYENGREGYRVGFEAGQAAAPVRCQACYALPETVCGEPGCGRPLCETHECLAGNLALCPMHYASFGPEPAEGGES